MGWDHFGGFWISSNTVVVGALSVTVVSLSFVASSLVPSAFKASKTGAKAVAVAVVFEESSDSGGKLSDTNTLVTFPSTFIFEKLLSALTSAGAGSEKANSTLGDDTADGTECEGGLSGEASATAASLS